MLAVFALTLPLGIALVLVGSLAFGVTVWDGFRASCSLEELERTQLGRNSYVYAADGSLLAMIPAEATREPIELDEMGSWLAKATVAIEDRRFWEHGGVDLRGVVRAAAVDLHSTQMLQGASTITMQLVRNLYEPIGTEKTWRRKLDEVCLAIELDESWSKERILKTYLNQVYFGNRSYGVEAAALTYFGKRARYLTLSEAALLAGLLQAPSSYDPLEHPRRALRRRDEVLSVMREQGMISTREYELASSRSLELKTATQFERVREPLFVAFVREQLTEHYDSKFVQLGGLKVKTTIDPRLQRLALASVKQVFDEPTDPAAALVAIDPRSGEIKAMVSVNPSSASRKFNLAVQGRRQAGSTFKTFVLVQALRRGIDPDTTYYLSAPLRYQPDPELEPWEPKTYDGTYAGSITLTDATIRSDNAVYARLTLDLGPGSVAQIARELGIETELDPVPSIGLGSNEVTVLEMASAYATLAAGGVHAAPSAVTSVELSSGDIDRGWDAPKRERVIPDWVAAKATEILSENMRSGTGTGAWYGAPAAGKTGTTDLHTDAWFVGYTPRLAVAVWVGYPNAAEEMANVHGITVTGGSYPADIWRLFMSRALPGDTTDFPPALSEPRYEPWSGVYQYASEIVN